MLPAFRAPWFGRLGLSGGTYRSQSAGSGIRHGCVVVLIGFLVVLLGPSRGWAERPQGPRFFPEETLAYVRIENVPQMVERFQQTAAGRISSDQQMKPLLGDLYTALEETVAPVSEFLGVSLGDLLRLPQGELLAAVVAPQTGRPQLALVIDVKDQLATAQTLLSRLDEQLIQRGGGRTVEDVMGVTLKTYEVGGDARRLVIFEKEGSVVFTTDAALSKQLLEVWNASDAFQNLSDHPHYQAIMKRCEGSEDAAPQVTYFVRPIDLVKRITRGNFSAQATLATLNGLGFGGLQAVGGTFAFGTEQFDSLGHLHVLLETPREGVIKALAMTTGDTAPESWVPTDVVSYTTLHWDLRETLVEAERLFDLFRGEGAWQDQVLGQSSERLGVPVQAAIFDQFAGRATLVYWNERPARLNAQATLIGIQVNDPKQVQATLQQVAGRLPETMTEERFGGTILYRLPARAGRRAPDPTLARVPEPCVAVVTDYVLVADSLKLLKEAIVTQQTGGGLASDLEFKLIASEVRRQVRTNQSGLVTFRRPEESLRALYELGTSSTIRERMAVNAPNNRAIQVLYESLQKNPLPPFSLFAQYLAPGGALLTNEANGFHYTTFTLRRNP
jgi:hypothetical protein